MIVTIKKNNCTSYSISVEGLETHSESSISKCIDKVVSLQEEEQKIDKLKAEAARFDAERKWLHYKNRKKK